jgi:GNAT superfamily N-acetyltransferase
MLKGVVGTGALSIERVTAENFDEFLGLVEKLAEYERLDPPDDEAKARLRRDGLADPPLYEACLGRLHGAPAGYAIFFPTYSSFLARPTLYLEDLFVLEKHRRGGIGQALFEYCVGQARERGFGRMEWCVLDWNEPAIRFYEKNGARRLGWLFYRLDRKAIEAFPGR